MAETFYTQTSKDSEFANTIIGKYDKVKKVNNKPIMKKLDTATGNKIIKNYVREKDIMEIVLTKMANGETYEEAYPEKDEESEEDDSEIEEKEIQSKLNIRLSMCWFN